MLYHTCRKKNISIPPYVFILKNERLVPDGNETSVPRLSVATPFFCYRKNEKKTPNAFEASTPVVGFILIRKRVGQTYRFFGILGFIFAGGPKPDWF